MYQTMKPVYQSAFFMRIIETLELLIKSVHQFYNTILLINIQYTHIIGMCVIMTILWCVTISNLTLILTAVLLLICGVLVEDALIDPF